MDQQRQGRRLFGEKHGEKQKFRKIGFANVFMCEKNAYISLSTAPSTMLFLHRLCLTLILRCVLCVFNSKCVHLCFRSVRVCL